MSNVQIGKRLGMTEAAVRKRVRQLQERGVIRIVAVLNPRQMGFSTVALVGIRISASEINRVAMTICQFPEVQYAAHATGAYDFVVEVWLSSNEEIHTFLADKLGAVPGIISTEASVLPKLLKSNYEFTDSIDDFNNGMAQRASTQID